MIDTDKYEGFEVTWLCEIDEENWDGTLGGGKESPRPWFHTKEDAIRHVKEEKLRTRASIQIYELVEGEPECVDSIVIAFVVIRKPQTHECGLKMEGYSCWMEESK